MSNEVPRRPAETSGAAGPSSVEPVHSHGLPLQLKFLSELKRRNVGRVATADRSVWRWRSTRWGAPTKRIARAPSRSKTQGWLYQIAQIYAHRGDVEQAFAWLDRAYEQRDSGLGLYLKGDPLLENLRSDPRYVELLRKMNLPL